MKFIELNRWSDGEIININVNHIVIIAPKILETKTELFMEISEIVLSNSMSILVAEDNKTIEKFINEVYKSNDII